MQFRRQTGRLGGRCYGTRALKVLETFSGSDHLAEIGRSNDHIRMPAPRDENTAMFFNIDNYVLHATGTIAGRYAFFDKFAVQFLELYSVKLLPLMAALIYLWFLDKEELCKETLSARRTVVEAIAAMFAAVVVSRLVQNLSPLRLRPLHAGDPAFVAPIGTKTETLEHWSSFPSDHAALSFALSTALCHFSRPLGALAYAWSVLIVCLPRIYAGYHYASDILSGAIIGIVLAVCVCLLLPTKAIVGCASNVAARYPGPFNAGLFILMFFFSTMFDDVRKAIYGLLK